MGLFGRPRARVPMRRLAAVVALVVALAIPATALGIVSGLFADVPPSNPFFAAINALGGAGITTGCGGGNFCPRDNISREAEAAFVNRGMPRVALSSTLITTKIGPAASASGDIASVSITVGGMASYDASAQQFVEVHGHFTIYGDGIPAACPCPFGAWIQDETTASGGNTYFEYPASNFYEMNSGDISWVFPAAPGAHIYTMVLAYTVPGAGSLNIYSPTLIATTVPFGDTGGNVVTPQAPTHSHTSKAAGH